MDKIVSEFVGLFAMIVGVAILAVIVSRNSNTAGVLTAFGNTFANSLSAATGPVSGSRFGGFSAGIGSSIF